MNPLLHKKKIQTSTIPYALRREELTDRTYITNNVNTEQPEHLNKKLYLIMNITNC